MDRGTDDVNISALILTRNEAAHIERCILSAIKLTDQIYVVDSASSDGTPEIARGLGAKVITYSANSFADKLNWCMSSLDLGASWVIRIDADEVLDQNLIDLLPKVLSQADSEISGYYVRRQLWFLGKWIRWGGMYPTYSLRIWRQGCARCESRKLDEHILVTAGKTSLIEADIIDNPLTTVSAWIVKHDHYARLEAESEIDYQKVGPIEDGIGASLFGTWAQRRRWLKQRLFYKLPLFLRPVLYFIFRYFFQLGFLDGKIGFIFHFMHGLWYRILVDAKVLESKIKSTSSIGD